MNRIEELEREIELKKAELKALKKEKHLNFDVYNQFESQKYGNYSLGNALSADLRSLATRLVSITAVTRTHDGSQYLNARKKTRIADMTQDEISFCNDFLNELYPIIEKYAIRVLYENKNKGGENEG